MIKVKVLFIIIIFSFFPVAFAEQSGNLIHKSDSDTRQYKAITLANQMTVLLIDDPQAQKSLAAVGLPVGSLEDPVLQQGLAHYLEHMVLMGSKKYPQPDSFSEYLTRHAGRHNASTAAYRTAYYLEVENSAFAPAVDRLANALGDPLFDPVNADRERHAVNAELTMARSRDGMRIRQVEAETINQQHPAALFAGGNLETLRDKPNSILHQELKKFYQRYYSANIMVGVLYSNQSLDNLAHLAQQTFGQIPNRHIQAPQTKTAAITEKQTGVIIHYVPAQPYKMLQVQFPIDNNRADFGSKTDEYIGYLLSNRSENTLNDWLQKQGLIEGMSAYANPTRFRNSGLFTVSFSLTDKGLDQRDTVISALVAYLKQIRQQGIKQRYFDEIKHVLDLRFRYADIQRDMDYVEWLVDQMMEVPIAHVLDSTYVADQFDPQAIDKRLASMTMHNARIWYISPQEPHNKMAYFVQAPYQIKPINNGQYQQWQTEADAMKPFNLPALNQFIPDDFSIMSDRLNKAQPPKIILNGFGVRALYAPGYYFANEPKLSVTVALRSKQALQDGRQQVLAALTNYLAESDADLTIYQASVGGISFNSSLNDGLVISVSGFNQRLPGFLLEMLKHYQHFTATPEQLQQAKAWYLQQLAMTENVRAFELAYQPVRQLQQVPYVERQQRRLLLDDINLNDIYQYRQQLFHQASLDVLALGNSSVQQVKQLTQAIHRQISNRGSQWYRMPQIQIANAQTVNLEQQAGSSDSALAAVYIPLGYSEMQGQAISSILSQILQPWFYNQLRTTEQLGYAVFSFNTRLGDQSGLAFLLQSNNHDPQYLYQRYQAFYQQAIEKLNDLSDEDFVHYRQAVIDQLLQHPQTFDEEADRYSSDFMRGRFKFDSRQQLIEQLAKTSRQQVIGFYRRAVIEHQGLVLISQVLGKSESAKHFVPFSEQQTYPDVSTLQKLFPKRD